MLDEFYMEVDSADLARMDEADLLAEAKYLAACERDALELRYERDSSD